MLRLVPPYSRARLQSPYSLCFNLALLVLPVAALLIYLTISFNEALGLVPITSHTRLTLASLESCMAGQGNRFRSVS